MKLASMLTCCFLAAIAARVVAAQPQWTTSPPECRAQHALSYDSARGETLLVGGYVWQSGQRPSGTFAYNGADWIRVANGGPSAGEVPLACYDSWRARTVLACGTPAAPALWEWDGAAWTQRGTTLPPTVTYEAMAFDSHRGVSVTFGSDGKFQEWDGTTMTTVDPGVPLNIAVRTLSGAGHAIVYDSLRQRIVLIGRSSINGSTLTWTWDGTTATQVSVGSPDPRIDIAAAYDIARDKIVLFGGFNGSPVADTWEFNGTTWSQVFPSGVIPTGRFVHRMCYDSVRGKVVMYGGLAGSFIYSTVGDTWEWDGTTWTLAVASAPPPLIGASMAFDAIRNQSVLFGGFDSANRRRGDTWTLDASGWVQRASSGPAPRYLTAMCWDSARGNVVLFGGSAASYKGDTWIWDGSVWTEVAGGPSPRSAPIAFDPDHGQVVLFGGYGGSYLGDTWVFDGTSWTQASTTGPAPRSDHSMAWDPASHRIILFGGLQNSTTFGDTWAWDGTAWTQVVTTGPSVRRTFAMCTDADAGRVLLFGGYGGGAEKSDYWEYQSGVWTLIPFTGPEARQAFPMTYDSARHATVICGGRPIGSILGDTWICSEQTLSLTSGPADQTVASGDAASLTVDVAGTPPFAYQWRKDGEPLVDDGRIVGVLGPQLQIASTVAEDAAAYTVQVRDSFGAIITASASISLACAADFDGDGSVDFFDYDAFVTCFEGGPCPSGKTADFDGDGSVDFFDYDAFVVAFESPC